MLTKPKAPVINDPNDASKTILDKEGEEWVIYQLKLKKFINCITKLDNDLQQIYNIVIGQCSPVMEQAL